MKNIKGDYFSVRFYKRTGAKKTVKNDIAKDVMVTMTAKKSYKKHDLSMIFYNKVLDVKRMKPCGFIPKSFFIQKEDKTTADKEGLKNRALWMAAQKGDCYALRLLVLDGVDLDARDGIGRTALNIAMQYNQTQAIKTLMAAKEMRRMAKLGELPSTVFYDKFKKNKTSGGAG